MEHEPVKVFDRVKMPAPLIFLAVVMIILLVGASNQLDNSQNFEKISKKAIINSYKKYSSKNNVEGEISEQEKELMKTKEFKKEAEKHKMDDESLKNVKENLRNFNMQVKKQNIITLADKR